MEEKKVDIRDLYKREKLIKVSDDEGNYSEILIVKMTQANRAEILKRYMDNLAKIEKEMREAEAENSLIHNRIKGFNVPDIILTIIEFESAKRNEIADLYPKLEGKSEEEKTQIIKEEMQKFKDARKLELEALKREELNEMFVNLTIESQSMVDSLRVLNLLSVKFMCVNPETKKPIFNSIEDIESLSEGRVLDVILKEVNEFKSVESQKNVRKLANDPSFLAHGESAKA